MFHSIRQAILDRMQYLEKLDSQDREDGTPRQRRLRQIPPITGRFIAMTAANAPDGEYLEVGTSAGYSTLWLALACEILERPIVTFEILPEKVKLAQETFQLTQLNKLVTIVEGDARENIPLYKNISFCFLDAEKEVYGELYELVVPRLVQGGWLLADNAINHREKLKHFLERALTDQRIDALIVPIGKGVLICRKA